MKSLCTGGDSGIQYVCVRYHENVGVILGGGNILSLTTETNIHLPSYKECLKKKCFKSYPAMTWSLYLVSKVWSDPRPINEPTSGLSINKFVEHLGANLEVLNHQVCIIE